MGNVTDTNWLIRVKDKKYTNFKTLPQFVFCVIRHTFHNYSDNTLTWLNLINCISHSVLFFNSLVTNQWPQLNFFQCHYHLQTLSLFRKDFCNFTWSNGSHFGSVSRFRKYCLMWSKFTFQIISFILYFALVQIFT